MAYDNQGAAIGAAGHYASALTAALITRGDLQTDDEILASFRVYLAGTFAMCEELKGEQPEQEAPKKAWGGKSSTRKTSGGGGNADPGTLEIRSGKHAGETIAAVYESDPAYLEWCVENLKNDFLVQRIEAYLSAVAA